MVVVDVIIPTIMINMLSHVAKARLCANYLQHIGLVCMCVAFHVTESMTESNDTLHTVVDKGLLDYDRKLLCICVCVCVCVCVCLYSVAVCNFVVHDRCMKTVVSPCSSIATSLIKVIQFSTCLIKVIQFSTCLLKVIQFSTSLIKVIQFSTSLFKVIQFSTCLIKVIQFSTCLIKVIQFSACLIKVIQFSTSLIKKSNTVFY